MKTFRDSISSPLFLLAVSAPMVLWLLMSVYGWGMSFEAASGTVSFGLFFVLLCACVCLSAVYRFLDKDLADGLVRSGIALVLMQGIAMHAFDFRGLAGIGEGEASPAYHVIKAGPFSALPELPVALVKVVSSDPQRVVVAIDGRERELEKGQTFSWKSYRLKMTELSAAPLFILRDSKGLELEGGYIKLAFHDAQRSYFQFSILPHRFYVSPAGAQEESWKIEDDSSSSWKRTAAPPREYRFDLNPRTFHIVITRGKLHLFDGKIERGKPLRFEGYSITFGPGAPWLELEVTWTPTLFLFYAGLALAAVGVASRFFIRRPA